MTQGRRNAEALGTLYIRGAPGWGVYDDTDPTQVAAQRLRFILSGDGFPAVAMGSVGRGA